MPARAPNSRLGYCALLKTAPAFSFGNKYDYMPREPGPGPGEYQPSRSFHQKGIGFGSSARGVRADTATPSPLDYQPSMAPVRTSASSFTFGMKTGYRGPSDKTPGPGAYNPGPSKDTTRPGQPPLTIAPKTKLPTDSDRKPGPQEYNPAYETKEPHAASIKFRHEVGFDQHAGPGPIYNPDTQPKFPARGATFGVSRSGPSTTHDGPGPIYTPDRGFDAILPSHAAWTMTRARYKVHNNGVPGPGNYGTHEPVMERPAGYSVVSDARSQPAYTITGKYFQFRPAQQPGPSDYKPKEDITRKSAPVIGFHGAEQKDSRRNYPAPNHYPCEDVHKFLRPHNPPLTMAPRYKVPSDKDRKPGPGVYDPEFEAKERPGVTLKFRHEPKFQNEMHGTPAPHDYANKDFVSIYNNTGKLKRGKTFGYKPKARTYDTTPGPIYDVGVSTLGVAGLE